MSNFEQGPQIAWLVQEADEHGIDPSGFGSLYSLGPRLELWGAILAAREAREAMNNGDTQDVSIALDAFTNRIRAAQGALPINPAYED